MITEIVNGKIMNKKGLRDWRPTVAEYLAAVHRDVWKTSEEIFTGVSRRTTIRVAHSAADKKMCISVRDSQSRSEDQMSLCFIDSPVIDGRAMILGYFIDSNSGNWCGHWDLETKRFILTKASSFHSSVPTEAECEVLVFNPDSLRDDQSSKQVPPTRKCGPIFLDQVEKSPIRYIHNGVVNDTAGVEFSIARLVMHPAFNVPVWVSDDNPDPVAKWKGRA